MFALILAGDGFDAGAIIAMLLIHDIVEIDAGDAPIHGVHDAAALEAAERQAADRLFGILPTDQAAHLLSLWREFENAESPEARFAKSLDRLQPLLLNTLTGGGTWTENSVSEQQVYERYGPTIAGGSRRRRTGVRLRLRIDLADRVEDLSGRDPRDVERPDDREDVSLEPACDQRRVARGPG